MPTAEILSHLPRCLTCTGHVSSLRQFHHSVYQGGCMTIVQSKKLVVLR